MSSIDPAVPVIPPPVSAFERPASMARAVCPRCSAEIDVTGDGTAMCPHCAWRGEIYLFQPLALTVEHSEQALAEDATCIHHPTKKAVAVCAGTGDYICALCAVELKGETYSASYLNTAGKDKARQAFDRYLERPDNTIVTLLVLCFVPYINFVVFPLSIFWIPYAFYLYFKALRLRRGDRVYARVMGMGRVITLPILLGLFSLGWIGGLIALIVAFGFRH